MVLGEMMSKLKRFSESADFYGKAVHIDSLYYKPVFFPLANAEIMSGRYAAALIHYKCISGAAWNFRKKQGNCI